MIVRLENDRVDSESVRAAVKKLRKANALMFPDGYYHGHLSEDQAIELLNDPHVKSVYDLFEKTRNGRNAIYASTQTNIYGVKFFKDLKGDRFPWIEGLDE